MDNNNFFVHLRIFHEAEENAIDDSADTLTNEAELERWWELEFRDFDLLASIALDDAKFVLWRASVNEGSSPPAQNPGGLLLEEISPLLAPVTNTDDSKETTRGNLGDDAN